MAESTIIVEDRLAELFSLMTNYLANDGMNFVPVFMYGDQKELNAFLAIRGSSSKKYPLIWLLYPYEENHSKNKVNISNMSLVLAIETNASYLNFERIEKSYKEILIKLFNAIKVLFRTANTLHVDDDYTVIKYPNYSGDDNNQKESETIYLWDALKITFDCEITNVCLRTKNI